MIPDSIRNLANSTAQMARETAWQINNYILAQRRKLAITAIVTFVVVEVAGNALSIGYPLVTTGTMPARETIVTNALVITLIAIAIEHLALYETLRIGYLKAVWKIAGRTFTTLQLRQLVNSPQDRPYLPPTMLVGGDNQANDTQDDKLP